MPRVIIFEFAGRQANLELQLPFIRRILDENPAAEFHLWNMARTKTDADYLRTLADDRISVLEDFHTDKHRLGWNKIYKYYAAKPELKDHLFVKLDDDVVFIQTQRFNGFLEAINTYRDHIISANVINNGACTPIEPGIWEAFNQLIGPRESLDPLPLLDVHKSSPYAQMAHQYFFDHHATLLRQKIELIPTHDWLSINAIGYDWNMACEIAKLAGTVPHPSFIAGRRFPLPWGLGDESICNMFPRIIMRGFLVGHLGFGPQEIPDNQLDQWRAHYAEINHQYLGLPTTRLQQKLPTKLSPASQGTKGIAEPDHGLADWAIRSGWDAGDNNPAVGRFRP